MRSGGTEFSSQAALQNYLQKHPNADVSKHSVASTGSHKEAAEHAEKTSANAVASKSPAAHSEAAAAMTASSNQHQAVSSKAKSESSRLSDLASQHEAAAKTSGIASQWKSTTAGKPAEGPKSTMTPSSNTAHELSQKAIASGKPEDHAAAAAAVKKASNEHYALHRQSDAQSRKHADMAKQHREAASSPAVANEWHRNVHG